MSRKSQAGKRIRKGDTVIVTTGNDKGRSGRVLTRKGDSAIVQGLNICKKHVKKSEAYPNGGFAELERPIHLSNLRLLVGDKAVRLRCQEENDEKQYYYLDGDQAVTYRSVKKADK